MDKGKGKAAHHAIHGARGTSVSGASDTCILPSPYKPHPYP